MIVRLRTVQKLSTSELRPAFETFSLAPSDPPTSTEARLLWDIGTAVHQYVHRVFRAGIRCPFKELANDAPERTA